MYPTNKPLEQTLGAPLVFFLHQVGGITLQFLPNQSSSLSLAQYQLLCMGPFIFYLHAITSMPIHCKILKGVSILQGGHHITCENAYGDGVVHFYRVPISRRSPFPLRLQNVMTGGAQSTGLRTGRLLPYPRTSVPLPKVVFFFVSSTGTRIICDLIAKYLPAQ